MSDTFENQRESFATQRQIPWGPRCKAAHWGALSDATKDAVAVTLAELGMLPPRRSPRDGMLDRAQAAVIDGQALVLDYLPASRQDTIIGAVEAGALDQYMLSEVSAVLVVNRRSSLFASAEPSIDD
ncbi:MAG: hypothetical protein AAFY64_10750, partial [Pseudomonadota bacterium]